MIEILKKINSSNSGKKVQVPHCVNAECIYYNESNIHDTNWRKVHGTYKTKAFGTVTRYKCTHCGRTFSDQSFSIDYYVKIPVDYFALFQYLISTSGQGNMTRFTGLRWRLIQNRYERLSRMFLALHGFLRKKVNVSEDLALDGFETFSLSQFFPCHMNNLVGTDSEYLYGSGYAQLRRKGRMTPQQKLRRKVLEKTIGKAPGNAIEKDVTHLLTDMCNVLQEKEIAEKVIRTDEHKAYVRAMKNVDMSDVLLIHEQYSSRTYRNYTNKLFAPNLTDRQLRKDQANHVRETVQFARCPSAMMTRTIVYMMYHNYIAPRRVKQQRRGNWETRIEMLGVSFSELCSLLEKYWNRRPFRQKCELWQGEDNTWFMRWRNKGIHMGRYVPKYIAA